MSRTSKALDATQLTLDKHTQILKRLEQNQVQILTNQAQIIDKLCSLSCIATPNQPANDVVRVPLPLAKPQRTHNVPPLTGQQAAERANAKLGFRYYSQKAGIINNISPWTVFISEGLIKLDNINHNKHQLTELGRKPENARLFSRVKDCTGHYVIRISPIAGLKYLVDWAEKHPVATKMVRA